jgi:hypothetical protein
MHISVVAYRVVLMTTVLTVAAGCGPAAERPSTQPSTKSVLVSPREERPAAADQISSEIPLDQIWAYDMPGTRDIRELEPELVGAQTKNLPPEKKQQRSAFSVVTSVVNRLGILTNNAALTSPKPGFAVLGSDLDPLRTAYDILSGKQDRDSFPIGSEWSVVFFCLPSKYSVVIDAAQKRTTFSNKHRVEVFYRFVPNKSNVLTAHLAIIPIGKMPAGRIEVRFIQDPMIERLDFRGLGLIDDKYADDVVCKSFEVEGLNGDNAAAPKVEWPAKPHQISIGSGSDSSVRGMRVTGPSLIRYSTNDASEETRLLEEIRQDLAIPYVDPKDAKPGFITYGLGREVLDKVYDILINDEQPMRKFLSDHDLSLCFHSRPANRYCHLSSIKRGDNRIAVHYQFVVHTSREATAHFAVVPLGKLSAGKYDVEMIQDPISQEFANWNIADMPPEVARRVVCKSFQFAVVNPPPTIGSAASPVKSTPLAPPAVGKVLDDNVLMIQYGPYTPKPIISPDGKRVAYFSRGKLLVVEIDGGPPRQLAEFTDTLDAILAQPNYADVGRSAEEQSKVIGSEFFRQTILPKVHYIFAFKWTHSSDGLLYGVQEPYRMPKPGDVPPPQPALAIYLAKLDGTVERLAEIPSDLLQRGLVDFDLIANGRYLLLNGSDSSLIYDLNSKRPLDHKFIKAVASTDGNTIFGFDEDTKKLIALDDQLNVAKRFDIDLPPSPIAKELGFNLDLHCSPDDRILFCRTPIGFDHSNNWIGFRVDLSTGERRELSGAYFPEQIQFTGNGGELARCGATALEAGYDFAVGAHLTIVPNGLAPDWDVWRIRFHSFDEFPGALANGTRGVAMAASPGGNMFALAIPRSYGKPPGVVWHFISRDGHTSPLAAADNGKYISPYEVVGFADGGHVLVAHDDTKLFTIPVPDDSEFTRSPAQ